MIKYIRHETIKLAMTALAGATFLLGCAFTVHAQQIINGSFEESNPVVDGGFVVFPFGKTITGWNVGGSVEIIHFSYWPAASGARSVDMSGFNAGTLSQTIETVPGVTYSVTFDMSGNPEGPFLQVSTNTLMTMVVTATGSPNSTYEYDIGEYGNSSARMSGTPDMMYQSKTYTFTAIAEQTELSFASQINSAFGPVLDNVAIIALNATVCHLNNGTSARKTLTVGLPARTAHLAHGDTAGPCPAE